MTTKIKICSDASVLIGAAPIQSFEEDSVEAITCEASYDDIYENLLRYRPWTFAREFFEPALINKKPETGYKYAYLIPNTVVTVMDVGGAKFKLVGKNELHTDIKDPRAYVIVKPVESDLPSDFILALKYAIASEISVPVIEDTTKAQFYEAKLSRQIQRAADNDLAQEPSEQFALESDLYFAHFGQTVGYGY